MPFTAMWMDLKITVLSKLDKYMISLMWKLVKIIQVNLLIKQKQTHSIREQIC